MVHPMRGLAFVLLLVSAAAPVGASAAMDWGDGIELIFQDSGPVPDADPGSIVINFPESAVVLSGVPTSRWTYGCSATSAGMMFGYYDRHGYNNMYTGPANGGVAPLAELGATCSIIATKADFDGRTARGHADDYWTGYLNPGPDPWQGHWTEHAWGDCTADYMGTSQFKWDFNGDGVPEFNRDGATSLFMRSSATPLYDYIPPAAAGLPQTALDHGMRLFVESRGYEVLENYNQAITERYTGGFSFADCMDEIDAGLPVMLQLEGHSIVGMGYDELTRTVYVHDTWDNYVHQMAWGDRYANMLHKGVTIIHLAEVPEPATLVLLACGAVFINLRRRKSTLCAAHRCR